MIPATNRELKTPAKDLDECSRGTVDVCSVAIADTLSQDRHPTMPPYNFDQILSELIKLTIEHAHRKDVSADTHFISDLALSSLKVMDLMADVEDLFDIEIPLDQLPQIRTVRDAAQQVTSILGRAKKLAG